VSDGVSQEGTRKDTGVERVGVVGFGLMGSGIAEVCARAGKSVIVCEASDELVAAGRKRIEASMNRAVTKEKLGASQRDAALARLAYTTTLDDRPFLLLSNTTFTILGLKSSSVLLIFFTSVAISVLPSRRLTSRSICSG
jgi:D-arabinose 1-dehydrogenase-like Zn-dependent alcohol dehydrogenase